METELKSPENSGGREAHQDVEHKSLTTMHGIAGAKTENVVLVQNIFHHQPHSSADQDRQGNSEGTPIHGDREFLRSDVGHSGDQRKERIRDR
ncbi:hypothetical protein D3C71_1829290 [compost metagenome]